MRLEANRKKALHLIRSMATGRIDLSAMRDDAVWWVPGRPEMTMETFRPAYAGLENRMSGPGVMEIGAVLAEGDRVAIQAQNTLPMKDGRTYSNRYHFLIEFDETGQIVRVNEYCDTAYARDYFSR